MVDVVTAEALSRGLGRVVAADVLGSSDDVWAPERLRLLLEARKGELLKDLHRREAEEKAQRRGSLGIHNEVAASAFRRARSCWSVRHHWVEFDWREKVLVGLVLVLFACQAVLALLLLIFGSHVPECASEAGAVDGVVGRKTALLGPLLVIVSYFQLQAAMHGILDDNVSEMVALPTVNFALSLIYILTFPSQAANDEGEAFGLSAKLGAGMARRRTGTLCTSSAAPPASTRRAVRRRLSPNRGPSAARTAPRAATAAAARRARRAGSTCRSTW